MPCKLSQKKCLPCKETVAPLQSTELTKLADQLGMPWQVVDGHHLEREYSFRDFREALDFTNRLGEIAEAEGHHPDILLAWGKVCVTVFTHQVDGLTENDFVLAARFEECWRNRPA